jgi:excisionase family DNA binding protein
MTTEATSSYLDTLSGREENHNRKQGRESMYVTIQEAARRCGVSDKTIQRAIRAGTLPARYPLPNRCEIAVSDLNSFMSGHVQTPVQQNTALLLSGHVQTEMEHRVAALEERVQQLEHLVTQLLARPTAQIRKSRLQTHEHKTEPLPKQLISLLAFTRQHNIAKSTVQTHMDMGVLPVKQGIWTDVDGEQVMLALDPSGRTAFYQMYRSHAHFMKCPQCPHGYQDSVSGQG